jgi:hypothetical protein
MHSVIWTSYGAARVEAPHADAISAAVFKHVYQAYHRLAQEDLDEGFVVEHTFEDVYTALAERN